MSERFSVTQFFKGGMSERVRDGVSAEEAVKTARHYTDNVAAKLGLVERVIITDEGDSTVLEWVRGRGVTWPLQVAGRR